MGRNRLVEGHGGKPLCRLGSACRAEFVRCADDIVAVIAMWNIIGHLIIWDTGNWQRIDSRERVSLGKFDFLFGRSVLLHDYNIFFCVV